MNTLGKHLSRRTVRLALGLSINTMGAILFVADAARHAARMI